MGRASTYGYINAKLRARISTMLSREWMLSMAGTRSLTEAVAMLSGTMYESASVTFQQTGDLKLVEAEILRRERDDVSGTRAFLTGPAATLADALFRRYEIETLKNALRVWFSRVFAGHSIEDAIPYLARESVTDSFSVDEIVNAADVESLLAALSHAPYAAIVAETLPKVVEQKTLFSLELGLDKWYFTELRAGLAGLERHDAVVAGRLLGVQVDLLNLYWIAHSREFYKVSEIEMVGSLIPGGAVFDEKAIASISRSDSPLETISGVLTGRYGSADVFSGESDEIRKLALLSAVLEEVLMHEIRRVMGGYPFSVGIVLAYAFLRQNEARMITTVLNARFYDLAPEAIGSML